MEATLKNSPNHNQGKHDPIVAKIYNPFAKLCIGFNSFINEHHVWSEHSHDMI